MRGSCRYGLVACICVLHPSDIDRRTDIRIGIAGVFYGNITFNSAVKLLHHLAGNLCRIKGVCFPVCLHRNKGYRSAHSDAEYKEDRYEQCDKLSLVTALHPSRNTPHIFAGIMSVIHCTMGFDASQTAVYTGSVPMSISGYSWTEERAKNYELSDYYYAGENETRQALLVKKENADKYTTPETLSGKDVGAQNASLQMQLVTEQLTGANPISIGDITVGVMELKSGNIEALAAITVSFGTVFASVLALMKMSKIPPLRWLSTIYIEIIRGTPMLLQLYFFYFGLPILIPALTKQKFLCMQEVQSAALLCSVMEQEGFAVEKGICSIPTAFSASYGSGKPIIGFLAEYDALSGLSQAAGSTEYHQLVKGSSGHGCGHNLLGVGAMAAAIGMKHYLQSTGKSGTVILYGCPGEEGVASKAYMAREGLWYGLDAALTWHAGDCNEVATGSTNSCIQMVYTFHGVASQASTAPERGRSVLDAVELMNVGVQFLREHMPLDARVHYSILDAGGVSPNVVQPEASVLYMIRSNTVCPTPCATTPWSRCCMTTSPSWVCRSAARRSMNSWKSSPPPMPAATPPPA